MKLFPVHRTLGELVSQDSIGSAACPLIAAHENERLRRAQTDRAWARQFYPTWWQGMVPHVVKGIGLMFGAGFIIMLMGAIASIGGGR